MKKSLLLLVTLITATIAFAKTEIDGIYYNLNNSTQTAEVTYQYKESYDNYSGVTAITIPEKVTYNATEYSITSIGNYAFQFSSSLTSVTIPNSVTSIGYDAFYCCSSLTSISIPNSVTSIGSSAFSSCRSLTSITIPNSVTSIEDDAFRYCSSLTSITIPNSVTFIGNYAFSSCSSLKSITIPNSVTSIGYDAFGSTAWLNNQPDGCVYINNYLYTYKGEMPENTHIDVNEGTTMICAYAFQNCSSLTSITIPNSVTYIGGQAFYNCSSLTSITIPNSVTSIENYTFFNCSSLSSITIPNSIIFIGDDAFRNCSSLTSITIPNSVTSIESSAFYGCDALTSITIEATTPPTLHYSLYYNGIIYIPNNTLSAYKNAWGTDYNFVNNENSLTIHVETPGKLSNLILNAGQHPTNVVKLIVTGTLNDDDFTYMRETMTSLVDVDLSGITNTTGVNFNGKSNLLKILLPENLTSIEEYAFYECSSLTSISIPNSVTYIGDDAFNRTPWLNNQPDGCVYINNLLYTYKGEMPQNTHIDVNEGTTMICNYAFYKCSSLTSISIPNSVTSIGKCAFQNCSSLTSITIPNSVTEVCGGIFYGCKSLKSVILSENMTSLPSFYAYGESAGFFENCTSLTSISIPNSVTYIGGQAFYNCSSLTSISIPNGVTSIEYEAFRYCSYLTSISIPNSVTEIENYAFYGCSSLTSISIPNSITSIGYSAFSGCSSLTSITIPNSITYIEDDTFEGCSSLTSVSIPNSVTYIGYYAFSECSSLTSITIPNSVISIDESAFEDCNKLRTVQIGKSIETIEGDAFAGCTALYSITINAVIPPIIDATTFTDVSHTAQIKVPCNAVAAYQASNYWNKFTNYTETPYSLTVVSNDNTMGNAVVIKQPTCQDIIAQVQAQALPGYEFVKWSDGFTENPHTIYTTSDTTITAEFRKINEEPEDKHNIFIVESADKTQGDVTITITANAIEGFVFSHWSDGSTENPRIVTLDENIELYAYFKVAEATNVETSKISSANIYTTNGTLHIEGATGNYHILDAAGRLIYSGNATTLQLPQGIYLITMGGEVEKIVL